MAAKKYQPTESGVLLHGRFTAYMLSRRLYFWHKEICIVLLHVV